MDQSRLARSRHVHVIGAGIVGTSCAWWLRRAGFDVTLIEKGAPACGASSGNAGSIGLASVPPLGMPGILRRVPKMLLDPDNPLTTRWAHLAGSLPWFARLALATQGRHVESIADARAALLARTTDALDTLLGETGLGGLIEHSGLIHTFQSEQALSGATRAIEMRRERGVELKVLNGDALRELEPALSDEIAGGVWYPTVRNCVNPQRLTEACAEAFVASGGRLLIETVRGFEIGSDGPKSIVTDRGSHPCELVVVAAGAWSKPLARQLGCNVALESERGYHVMLKEPQTALRIPLVSSDQSIAISPMEHGLRLTTMSEFAAIEAPSQHARAMRIFAKATRVVHDLKIEAASQWVGARPSTPDSLPVIGRSPRFRNALFAFGHGHLGLTFAAITGRLISQIASGAAPEVDIAAFRPDRSFTGSHLKPSMHA
ncbi:MAG: NAD(P)/FAD-dependent oxidoreductase [Burkholderiales bacterium]